MSQRRDLKFGETPWDDMPREELLREVQRMYSALVSARGVLREAQRGEEHSPYWKKNVPDHRGVGGGWGSGGEALLKVEQALAPYLDARGDDGNTYDAFFRYANAILFDGLLVWKVCDACEQFVGNYDGLAIDKCHLCGGDVRPLAWDDLRPQTGDAA